MVDHGPIMYEIEFKALLEGEEKHVNLSIFQIYLGSCDK